MIPARRVAITGVGIVAPAGLGAASFLRAVGEGAPLGAHEEIPTVRGRAPRVRVARVPAFDREAHIPSRSMRRMGQVSQIWTIACLLARADAGLEGEAAAVHPPGRRGTYLGTGFGCIDATWDYMLPMIQEGAGTTSPFLFSESVANAPAGHSAIAMDTRGASITFTCGDASACVAVSRAAEAIRQGRVDAAWAGGIDLMVPPLLRVLASLGVPFAGEGAVCLVLEEAACARRRGARVLAEVSRWSLASDPAAAATHWPEDTAVWEKTMRRALPSVPGRVVEICLHGATQPAARQAEQAAAGRLCPTAGITRIGDVMGMFGAAGGFSLAAAALSCAGGAASSREGDRLVSSAAWGGALASIALSPPGD